MFLEETRGRRQTGPSSAFLEGTFSSYSPLVHWFQERQFPRQIVILAYGYFRSFCMDTDGEPSDPGELQPVLFAHFKPPTFSAFRSGSRLAARSAACGALPRCLIVTGRNRPRQ